MITNTLGLCFIFLGLSASPTLARQANLSHDITTQPSPHSAGTFNSPTPTIPTTLSRKQKYSRNDPFRIFAPPSEPVCCLVPLPTAEPDPHPTDDLLPFEEWKARQLALSSTEPKRTDDPNGKPTAVTLAPDESAAPETTNGILIPVTEASNSPPAYPVADFVPIQGRFNYASLDCSARVHSSHKSMKSASSILSSKKDKYLLAPCSIDNKDIVVELCDDIRVDTVQLANFEFFSGVFKDIAISLGPTPDVRGPGWEIMGVYQAKNVRGVQTFRPFNRPHNFYRFIRIEFRTHYGKEYFCPVSLLRVYGLTQMEEWRMEEWEREWQARKYPAGLTISSEVTHASPIPSASSAKEAARREAQEDEVDSTEVSHDETGQDRNTTATDAFAPNHTSILSPNATAHANNSGLAHSRNSSSNDQGEWDEGAAGGLHSSNSSNPTDVPGSANGDAHAKTGAAKHSKTRAPASASAGTPVLRATHVPTPVPSSGGESIYRTIMNRLDILERNSTLSLRYVEEQNYSVRQALRRLEEEVGRLKALAGREQQELQRSMRNVERKQAEMEKRWDLLIEQVNTLAEEVVLEKRLGIVQLCLLTTVLVFMALTRGSRAETHLLSGMRRRVDSGLGLGRGLYPRHRAQSKPRAGERPLAWTRQDRRSTGDISHHESGDSPLTPVRSGSPPRVFGTPSSIPGRNLPRVDSRSPTRQASKGVRFPQGLLPFPSTRPGSSSGMRRSQSLSLSSEQLAVSLGAGRRPATGMKRLARTAHLHEVELESQRRLRLQAEQTEGDNDIDLQDHDITPNPFAPSMLDFQPSADHLVSDNLGQPSDPQASFTQKDPLNTGTFGRRSPSTPPQPDNGAEWEDTDADTDGDESVQEVIVEENMPAPRVPRLFSPPTPGTWGARRKARGFSVDTGTAFRMQQCA